MRIPASWNPGSDAWKGLAKAQAAKVLILRVFASPRDTFLLDFSQSYR